MSDFGISISDLGDGWKSEKKINKDFKSEIEHPKSEIKKPADVAQG